MEIAALSLRLVLAVVFVAAGAVKLSRLAEFEVAVRRYQALPERAVRPIARVLPPAEIGIGLALGLGFGTSVAAALLALLLVAFATSVGFNLLRGREFDCGCGASVAPRAISWSLVIQDIVLAGTAAFVAADAPRTFALDQLLSGTTGPAARDALAAPIIAGVLLIIAALVRGGLPVWKAIHE